MGQAKGDAGMNAFAYLIGPAILCALAWIAGYDFQQRGLTALVLVVMSAAWVALVFVTAEIAKEASRKKPRQ